MSSVYMVSDKNSINRHNPFVDTPPGARRAEFEYESFAQPHRGTGGYEVPEPEVSPACQYGVGGSDLRIGVPCDVQTLRVVRPLHPRRNIDEEILQAPRSGVVDARPVPGVTVTRARVAYVGFALLFFAAFSLMSRRKK
jgi:hypothetical protein